MNVGERNSYISGIGMAPVGRRQGLSEMDLTVRAVAAAIADAGLTPEDIDGLATYPAGAWARPAAGSAAPGRGSCRTPWDCSSTGQGGDRQVPRQPEASVVTNGAGVTVGCVHLTRGVG